MRIKDRRIEYIPFLFPLSLLYPRLSHIVYVRAALGHVACRTYAYWGEGERARRKKSQTSGEGRAGIERTRNLLPLLPFLPPLICGAPFLFPFPPPVIRAMNPHSLHPSRTSHPILIEAFSVGGRDRKAAESHACTL